MAKSVDTLDKVHTKIGEVNKKMEAFLAHQLQLIENYDIMMQNQIRVTDNHDIVVANQNTIIKNQGIITQNQSSIIHNQAVIVKNQAYLKTFLHTQSEILSVITQKPRKEIAKEINDFFENTQKEIAQGFEKPIGE
jgi:predicted metal-dependent hydrolase